MIIPLNPKPSYMRLQGSAGMTCYLYTRLLTRLRLSAQELRILELRVQEFRML